MNKKFKFLTVLLALVMTLGAFAPFSARAEEGTPNTNKTDKKTKTVTLHKLLMTEAELGAWDSNAVERGTAKEGEKSNGYNGSQNITQLNKILTDMGKKEVKEIEGVYFALALDDGQFDKDKTYNYVKALDNNNKLTPKFKASKPNEVETTKNVDEAVGGLTTSSGIEFKTENLKGKYIIVEIHEKSTYQGEKGAKLTGSKAVPVKITLPLVNNDGVVEDAHVYPKNIEDRPKIDKNFAKKHGLTYVIDPATGKDVGADYDNYTKAKGRATAEIGKEVKYEVKTFLPENAKYKTVIWKDSMTDGLTYNRNLVISGLKDADGKDFIKGTDYTLEEDDRGFTLTFTDDGIAKLETALKKGSQDVYLHYSATVNSNSVVDQPEKNHVTFEYKHTKTEPTPEPPATTPDNKTITVTKTWSEGQAPTGVVVVYTLQEKDGDNWKNVKSVTITKPDYNYTFTELDDAKTYRVIERVSGYTPEYKAEKGKYNVINNKNEGPQPLEPTTPEVVNGGKKFVKTNQDGTERLAGAEFYVKNKAGQYLVIKTKDDTAKDNAKKDLDKAIEEYNAMTKEQQEGTDGTAKKAEINTLQEAYNKAFIEAAKNYTWEDGTANAIVLTSNAKGQFEIKGLEYGTYYLEEKTAPKGYAKLSGPVEFEVKEKSYISQEVTKLDYKKIDYVENSTQKDAQQITNKKVSIPQTGGIGTVIFTVVGVMLMVGAAFALKRRKEDELEGLA